jgi:hypothetical protein
MSQLAFLQSMDAAIMSGLVDAGLGDAASYAPPDGGTPVDLCNVLLDDGLQEFGVDPMPVAGERITITLFLAEVPRPERNGLVTIGTAKYRLLDLVAQDQSQSRWTVKQ